MYGQQSPVDRLLSAVDGAALVHHHQATRRVFVWPGAGRPVLALDDRTCHEVERIELDPTRWPDRDPGGSDVLAVIFERVNAGY